MPSTPIAPRSHNVASEIIEGEAIIVDVLSGTYYSANPSASLVWGALLAAPQSADALQALLMQNYPAVPAERLANDLSDFIASLQAHDLLAADATESAAGSQPTAVTAATPHPYAPPLLEVHSDMRDFLLVDPIHEVSDAGFPEPRQP
jgi:hypothetical protein